MYKLFVDYKGKSVKELRKIFTSEFVDTCIDFFVENEYAFLTSQPSNFVPVEMNGDSPSVFSSAIIASDKHSKHNYELIFDKLEAVQCKDILFRCHDHISSIDFEEVMELIQGRRFNSIQWQFPFHENLTERRLIDWCTKYPRINAIVRYNSPTDKMVQQGSMSNVYSIKSNMTQGKVAKVKPEMFRLNQELFIEAQSFNTFYNKKLVVNERGMIKNGLNTAKEFGRFEESDLFALANNVEFQKLWDINKDKILVCKDCEFRYCCVDETIPLKVEKGYELETPCAYDPYSQKWK